jgi:hypothetical protein
VVFITSERLEVDHPKEPRWSGSAHDVLRWIKWAEINAYRYFPEVVRNGLKITHGAD